VEILFQTARLGKICNSLELLQKTYGQANADKIRCRLAVLGAATTLLAVPTKRPDRRHALKGQLAGCYAVDVLHPFRIVFRAWGTRAATQGRGSTAARDITAIIILEIVDYH